jgi:hypothetical protein
MKTLEEALQWCEERAAGNRVEAAPWRYIASRLRELQTLQAQWPQREREIEARVRAEDAAVCRAYFKRLEALVPEDPHLLEETPDMSIGRYFAAVDLETALRR